ncbi:MAG TPA: porphobilinogen synthase [Candidatus Ornithomonoglobus merdipullorum]|uniref:Delta-aminolevulinic acid dehydratase n=1 Tax=Candidatus Ornithomonoglobus merdipullorum TaxID=2840895 RepID=A0A9D1MD19_9FIRM|nr:porphobilinogen synthase [Candidatus Ornithomonoglobus merdipullorum]
MLYRPRRLRSSEAVRSMVRETRVSADSLIYPMFVIEGENIKEEIEAMPGQYRYSIDRMGECLEEVIAAGVKSVMLFGIPAYKDEIGSDAWDDNGIIQKALRAAKEKYPELYYITDVCLCEYTSHGHCGALCGDHVDNDKTLELLARTAVSHARAGADMVAPSDMMDGRVGAIRNALDENGFINTPIMAYSAKYASAFYGPFREAAGSAPAFGDRKSYQMDFHNTDEAVREAELDIAEGADIIMVKPGMAYLDVLYRIKEKFKMPTALYSVSGEYAMIKAGAKLGYIDEEKMICETAACMYRAGADILITYFAKEIAQYIKKGLIG